MLRKVRHRQRLFREEFQFIRVSCDLIRLDGVVLDETAEDIVNLAVARCRLEGPGRRVRAGDLVARVEERGGDFVE